MGVTAAGHLIKGKWPLLRRLDLSGNQLKTTAIAKLAKAKWPLLERLELSAYPMEPEALAYIVRANWSLKVLNLSSTCQNGGLVSVLVMGNWPLLEVLQLNYNHIGSSGAAILVKGNWPKLKKLGLHMTDLKEKSLKTLVEASRWPLLESLDLSKNRLGTLAYSLLGISSFSGPSDPAVVPDWLDGSCWPLLKTVDPHHRGFHPCSSIWADQGWLEWQ